MNFKSLVMAAMIGCSSVSMLPVLSPQSAIAASIQVGMSSSQVLRIMGKPSSKSPATGGGEFWVWNQGSGAFGCVIKDGKVVSFGALKG